MCCRRRICVMDLCLIRRMYVVKGEINLEGEYVTCKIDIYSVKGEYDVVDWEAIICVVKGRYVP